MFGRRTLALLALLAGTSTLTRPGAACEPARAAARAEPLPKRWQIPLDELVAATGEPGQPWACGAARLELELTAEGAVLRVERPGAEEMARHVGTPEELVPVGKAMLAMVLDPALVREPSPALDPPAPAPDPPAPAPDPPVAARVPREAPPASPADQVAPSLGAEPEPSSPRLLVEAVGLVRYHGGIAGLATGGGARVSVPLDGVLPSLWARYTVLAAHGHEAELELTDLDVGASLGLVVLEEPVRLSVGVHGSLAIVDMEAEDARDEESEVELVALDGRMGAELRLSVPIVSILRAVVALDGEIAPASLARERRVAPGLPPLPSYGLGASVGLEVEVP